jgi:hypothetical protein
MPLQWSTGLACFDPHAGASRAPARLPTNQTLDEVFGRDAGFALCNSDHALLRTIQRATKAISEYEQSAPNAAALRRHDHSPWRGHSHKHPSRSLRDWPASQLSLVGLQANYQFTRRPSCAGNVCCNPGRARSVWVEVIGNHRIEHIALITNSN